MHMGGLAVTQIFIERVLYHPRRYQLRLVVFFVARDCVIFLATNAMRPPTPQPSVVPPPRFAAVSASSQTGSGARSEAPGLRQQLHAPEQLKASCVSMETQTDLSVLYVGLPIVNFLDSMECDDVDDVPNCFHFSVKAVYVRSPRVPVKI